LEYDVASALEREATDADDEDDIVWGSLLHTAGEDECKAAWQRVEAKLASKFTRSDSIHAKATKALTLLVKPKRVYKPRTRKGEPVADKMDIELAADSPAA